ncbi:Fic family protein [Leptospira idonii]|uniref:Fido domain-containing protein n=1 Tax=Leptospira idonii TaxID=1193500 RepID=A0A4V3JXZ6_9LEPT|nr:hypothetical protein EHS15_08565 [Leptospira idonii]
MKIAFVQYLTLDEVVEIHKKQIQSYEKTLTSADRNILASSLSKVTGALDNKEFHYNLIEKASLYLFYLTKDRPFEDGNKKTAVASTLRFLKSNRISPAHRIEGALSSTESREMRPTNLSKIILIAPELLFF